MREGERSQSSDAAGATGRTTGLMLGWGQGMGEGGAAGHASFCYSECPHTP